MVTRVQLPLTEKNSSDQFASFDIVSNGCASNFNREDFLEFFFFFLKLKTQESAVFLRKKAKEE